MLAALWPISLLTIFGDARAILQVGHCAKGKGVDICIPAVFHLGSCHVQHSAASSMPPVQTSFCVTVAFDDKVAEAAAVLSVVKACAMVLIGLQLSL